MKKSEKSQKKFEHTDFPNRDLGNSCSQPENSTKNPREKQAHESVSSQNAAYLRFVTVPEENIRAPLPLVKVFKEIIKIWKDSSSIEIFPEIREDMQDFISAVVKFRKIESPASFLSLVNSVPPCFPTGADPQLGAGDI